MRWAPDRALPCLCLVLVSLCTALPLTLWPGFPPPNPPTLSGFRRFVHRNGRCAGVLARAAGLRKQEVKRRPHGPKLTLALHASGLLSVVSQTPTSQVPLKLARERASIGSTRLHTQRSYMHVLYECIGASYAVYNDIYIYKAVSTAKTASALCGWGWCNTARPMSVRWMTTEKQTDPAARLLTSIIDRSVRERK